MDLDLRIQIDAEASPEEVRAVEEVFQAFGMDAPVEATGEARPLAYTGEGNGTDWIIQVLLLGSTVGAFLTSYFGAAGQAAWRKTEDWVNGMREARRQSPFPSGRIRITDQADTELTIDLTPGQPPAEAWEALFELDWPELQGYRIYWNEHEKRWVPVVRGDLPPSRRRIGPLFGARGAIRVETDPIASDREVSAVEDALRDFGITTTVERQEAPVGAGGPGGWILHMFVSGFFGAAGSAAWTYLGTLVSHLVRSRETSPELFGRIIVSDKRGGDLVIDVTDRAHPEEAWDQLDLIAGRAHVRGHALYWDFDAGEWRAYKPPALYEWHGRPERGKTPRPDVSTPPGAAPRTRDGWLSRLFGR